MIVSAQELTRTRICAGAGCDQDADNNSHFCWRCVRRANTRLHQAPLVYTGPTLPCCACGEFKPDEQFAASNKRERRGRHQECRDCSKARRVLTRARMTPEQIAHDREKQRDRRRRLRAAWTPEQHEARRAQGREYDRARRAALRLQLDAVRQEYA